MKRTRPRVDEDESQSSECASSSGDEQSHKKQETGLESKKPKRQLLLLINNSSSEKKYQKYEEDASNSGNSSTVVSLHDDDDENKNKIATACKASGDSAASLESRNDSATTFTTTTTTVTNATPPTVFKPLKLLTLINDRGAIVEYCPRFITRAQSKTIMSALMSKAQWDQDIFKIHGKAIESPRLVCAFADGDDIALKYTGTYRPAQTWLPELIELKKRVEQQTGETFNYVLVNRYDNGENYIGWHSDKRTNMLPDASVVGVSLGQTRTFQFKNIATKKITTSQDLEDGSLIIMRGKCQELYKHSLPKRAKQNGLRLSLTFRYVPPASSSSNTK